MSRKTENTAFICVNCGKKILPLNDKYPCGLGANGLPLHVWPWRYQMMNAAQLRYHQMMDAHAARCEQMTDAWAALALPNDRF